MSSTSNLDEYKTTLKVVAMAVITQLHVYFLREHQTGDKVDINVEIARGLAKVGLAKVWVMNKELDDEHIESLKCEIKNMAQKAIYTVFNELFNKKEAPDATDSLPRH